MLRERLGELGVAVEYGSKLTGLRQDDMAVHAEFDSASGLEDASYAYIVGADGASSTVRGLLGIDFLGRTDETVRMLTADVEVSGLDRDFWHWWPSPDGKLMALCPLAATDTFQLQTAVATDTIGELSLSQINETVAERSGRTDIRVRRVTWQSIWRFNVRMVDRYRAGRVFLAGDSAHVHPPAGGLGMNTGIQDAHNLAWKLANVLRGAPEALLDTYEQERLPIAAHVLDLSSKLTTGRFKGVVPGGGGPGSDTRQLTVHYPVSNLNGSVREAGESVQAGDRAPDCLLRSRDGSTVRLFDLLRGPHTTALALGPRSSAVATALAERFPGHLRSFIILPAGSPSNDSSDFSDFSDHTFTDTEDHMRRDYAIGGDTLIVIRPDGYVGLRAAEPEEGEVLRYLRQLLPEN